MKSHALQKIWDSLTPEEQQIVNSGFLDLEREHLSLQELRQKLQVSQTQLAKALDINQVNVSRFEHRSDPRISTLAAFVAALGGELEISVRFADKPTVILKGFGFAAE